MSALKKGKAIAAAAVLMASFAASAAAEAARIALVVGNSAYSGDAVLKNPTNDASDMAAALKKAGWAVSTAIDVDRRAFNRAISAFRDSLAASDGASALFYYAGHGMQVDGINYLIPVRTEFETLDDLKADAIGLQGVTDAIAQGKAGVSLIILDACRDNPFAKKMSRSMGGARGLSVVPTAGGASGSVIMFSTSPGDIALDGTGRNGVFTAALLKYVDSDLKVEELFKKVTGDVRAQSSGAQNPWINASLPGDFYILSDPLRAAKAAEREKAAAAARQAELDRAAETGRAAEAAKTAAAKQEAAEARKAAEAALALASSERDKPKGKLRVESSVRGRVFAGGDLLGEVGPDTPLMSDSMPTGKQELRFATGSAPDEIKAVAITEKAYVVVSFGPASLGKAPPLSAASLPPGAISVSVDRTGAQASIDGGTEVNLPHIFEGIAAGSHVLRIENVRVGSRIFEGLEETVTVESGKRSVIERELKKAEAKLQITGIPEGARIFFDGDERSCSPYPYGDYFFEGSVDAGTQLIEVVKGNKTWSSVVTLQAGSDLNMYLKYLNSYYALPRRAIKVNGKDDDWKGIEPIFGPATYSLPPKHVGLQISSGSLCRDDKNLYLKIDISNGKPNLSALPMRSGLVLNLKGNQGEYHLSVLRETDASVNAEVYDATGKTTRAKGAYATGPSFVEMSFPLSWLEKAFDLSKPVIGDLGYWIESSNGWYAPPPVNLILK